MTMDSPESRHPGLVQVSPSEWDAARARESERATHPCDHWYYALCRCGGACGCHWWKPDAAREGSPSA